MNFYVDERGLLDVWEEVSTLSRPELEVAVLAGVSDQSTEQCSRLSIGERDRRLMLLHERTFGGRYDCETRCTACGMRMAFSFAASDLGLEPCELDPDALLLTEGRIVVKLRLPTSADITACLTSSNPAGTLFARCVKVQSSPVHRVGQMRSNDLPANLRQSAIERLAALDPNAELMFELECPSCGHDNKVMFDPVIALFTQAKAAMPASADHNRAAPPFVQPKPGATNADFLERLIRRHSVEAVVHTLQPAT